MKRVLTLPCRNDTFAQVCVGQPPHFIIRIGRQGRDALMVVEDSGFLRPRSMRFARRDGERFVSY